LTTSRKLVAFFIVVLVIMGLLSKFALVYTDWLWFDVVGYQSVFARILVSRLTLFVVFACAWLAVLYPTWQWARRIGSDVPSPIANRLIPLDDKLMLDRYIGVTVSVGAVVISLIAGLIASGKYPWYLRSLNPTPFSLTDPVFQKDIAFYVFQLPWWSFLYNSLYSAVTFALIGSLLLLVYDDALQVSGERFFIADAALKLLGLLIAALVFLKIAHYQLGAWNLLLSRHDLFTGANYTDVYVRLPALRGLMAVAFLTGISILFSARSGHTRIGVASLGIYWVLSLLAGSVLPSAFQRVFVSANELQWERRFLKTNIDFTRYAYDLDRIAQKKHSASESVSAAMLDRNKSTIDDIRVWDKNVLATYQQLQEIRSYYRFIDVDIDRYSVAGNPRQVMLAARELSYDKLQTDSWINYHLKYTHGYGFCMSPVNRTTPQGLPELYVKDIPSVVTADMPLQIDRSQIYFGEWGASNTTPADAAPSSPFQPGLPPQASPGGPPPSGEAMVAQPVRRVNVPYAIVNTTTDEFDYPSGDTFQQTTYEGTGGVRLSGFLRRLLYAWKFSSLKILVSSYVTSNSRIIYNREVIDRARLIAPFLRYDNDPYLVASGGRLFWILDAYTSTRHFPYSQEIGPIGTYLRSSIKVVVDAYDGTVDFYRIDNSTGRRDPLLESYARIFPGLFKPLQDMPEDLRKHLRYPQGYFMVQSDIYARYHMSDVDTFFSDEDRWEIPMLSKTEGNAENETRKPMEPFYVTMKYPGRDRASFMLIIPFAAKGKDNMRAWLAANCDDPHYGEMAVFTFPKKRNVYGPAQVKALINQNEQISQDLTLWGRQGSRISWGSLLVVPIEQALLYVQPLYLRSEATQIPELKRVIVVNGSKVSTAERLDVAINNSLTETPEVHQTEPAGAPDETRLTPAGPLPPHNAETVQSLVNKANRHYERSIEARAAGDWAAYGRELDALGNALKDLGKLQLEGNR